MGLKYNITELFNIPAIIVMSSTDASIGIDILKDVRYAVHEVLHFFGL